jgi:hypothetical protein
MRIYFDGDSFTRGVELINQTENRFSRLISDHYNTQEYNFSDAGACNGAIVRRLVVENNIKEYDLAVIQMTLPVRMEYYDGKQYKNIREKDFVEWKQFYLKNIYHDKFGSDYEYLYYRAIKDHCNAKGTPLIITTNRSYKRHSTPSNKRTNFDLYLDSKEYPRAKKGHPNQEGHRMIADDIIKLIDNYED